MNEQPVQPSGARRFAGVSAWLRLARVYQQVHAATERWLRGNGMTTAQFDVLAQLGATETLTQQELADALLVTKGNISQLLARMEESGLITRRSVGRCNRIALTDSGRTLHDRVVPQQEARIARQFATLTPQEQRTLTALLRKLSQTVTQQQPE